MKNLNNISHEEIKAYIHDACTPTTLIKIQKYKDEEYYSLFKIIDELKLKTTGFTKPKKIEIPNTFEETETALLSFFSGTGDEEFEQNFLNWIAESPNFYNRLVTKLNQISLAAAPKPVPELSEIYVKPDEQLLIDIGISKIKQKSNLYDFLNYVNSKINIFIKWSGLTPKYAYGIPTAVTVALVFFAIYTGVFTSEPFKMYYYDTKTPFPYDNSGLRGSNNAVTVNPDLMIFRNKFLLAMSDYIARDYMGAIKAFDEINLLVKKIDPIKYQSLLADYYFYLSLSHLALNRTKETNLSDTDKKSHLAQASQSINKSLELIRETRHSRIDREQYFYAIILIFQGKANSAQQLLKNIPSESEFFVDSQNLLVILSDDI